MLHSLIRIWFDWLNQWGYLGVFIIMAMESSIIPVPSELVMPPAAFWAAKGRMSMAGVILAGTAGSYFGSVVSYFGAQWLGLPLLKKYGKYILLPPKKIELAHDWAMQYGSFGIFWARLVPVLRHLISMPAGIFKMPFLSFSLMTILGAGIWCSILAWFGQEVLGRNPELLESPEAMVHVIKSKLYIFVGAMFVIGGLYLWITLSHKKSRSKKATATST